MRTMRFASTAVLLAGLALLPSGLPALAQAGGHDHHPAEAGAGPAPGPETDSPMSTGPDMPMMKGMAGDAAACPELCPAHEAMLAKGGSDDPVTAAFEAINRRMHAEMTVIPSGSADRDFATAMIGHHQGAIDMSKVVLGFGTDPEIRKLAEAIVAAQQQEIAVLRQWLAKQP